VDIATEPIELETLSYDNSVSRFIEDAERRGLRPDTITYYKDKTGMFRRWLVAKEKTDFISGVMRHNIDWTT